MVRPVTVPFAVRLVVLVVEGNEIVKREAVVTGDEIDALLGFALLSFEHIRAADQPSR